MEQPISENTTSWECAVIASMLNNDTLADQGLALLEKDDFCDPECLRVFVGMQMLRADDKKVNMLSVGMFFTDDKKVLQNLVDISTSFYLESDFEYYISELKKETKNRRLISGLTTVLERAKRREAGAISEAQDLIDKLSSVEDFGMKVARDYVPEAINKIGSREKGIKTGFYDLDAVTKGLVKGNLIIVAGRPSMGKSTFAANIAMNVAKEHVVAYFSLEMTSVEIVQRMIYGMSNISERAILKDIDDGNGDLVQEAIRSSNDISEMRLYLNENSNMTVSRIKFECKKIALLEKGLDLIVIDYLGLIQTEAGSANKTRQQEVTEITHALKRLAKELNVPIILVSQLNRNSEGRSDHTPMLADLSESASVEADADIVLFPYRPWVFDRERDQTEAELIVAKNRNGTVKKIPLYWSGETFTFKNLVYGGKE